MEDCYVRVAGWCAESRLDVYNAEAEGDEHDEAEYAVENYGDHHGDGEDTRGISDLFGCG